MRAQPGGSRISGVSTRPAARAVMEFARLRTGVLPHVVRPDMLARAIQARRKAAAGTAADASRRRLVRQS
jgi:hypothetical protein